MSLHSALSRHRPPLPPLSVQELLSNEVLRTHAVVVSAEVDNDPERHCFCRAVWELHSKIFHGYSLWLSNVNLKFARTRQAEAMLDGSTWDGPEAINGLITELAMYFLVRGAKGWLAGRGQGQERGV